MLSIHLVVYGLCVLYCVLGNYMAGLFICILYFHIWFNWLYYSGSNLFPTRVNDTVVGGPNSQWWDKVRAHGLPSRTIDHLCDCDGSTSEICATICTLTFYLCDDIMDCPILIFDNPDMICPIFTLTFDLCVDMNCQILTFDLQDDMPVLSLTVICIVLFWPLISEIWCALLLTWSLISLMWIVSFWPWPPRCAHILPLPLN
jgi:hypothetical protein